MCIQQGLRLVLAAAAVLLVHAGGSTPAAAVDYGAPDICRLYGYAPHSADYRLCRTNARHYWSTGECRHRDYALAHLDYCHLLPPPFLY